VIDGRPEASILPADAHGELVRVTVLAEAERVARTA